MTAYRLVPHTVGGWQPDGDREHKAPALSSQPAGLDRYVTVADAALEIGCTKRWVQLLVKKGEIQAEQSGRQLMVLRSSLDTYRRPRGERERWCWSQLRTLYWREGAKASWRRAGQICVGCRAVWLDDVLAVQLDRTNGQEVQQVR